MKTLKKVTKKTVKKPVSKTKQLVVTDLSSNPKLRAGLADRKASDALIKHNIPRGTLLGELKDTKLDTKAAIIRDLVDTNERLEEHNQTLESILDHSRVELSKLQCTIADLREENNNVHNSKRFTKTNSFLLGATAAFVIHIVYALLLR